MAGIAIGSFISPHVPHKWLKRVVIATLLVVGISTVVAICRDA